MLVPGIFYFAHNVFYFSQNKFQFLSLIYFFANALNLDQSTKIVVWERVTILGMKENISFIDKEFNWYRR